MKRILCVLAVLVMAMFATEAIAGVTPMESPIVASNATMTMVVTDESPTSVTYDVRLSGVSDLKAYGFTLKYDTNQYGVKSVMPGSENIFDGPGFFSKEPRRGEIMITNLTILSVPNVDGTIAMVKFDKLSSESSGGITIYEPKVRSGGQTMTVPTANIRTVERSTPVSFTLAQNFPNPFNPETQIVFSVPTAGQVQLYIYNAIGQRVATLVDKAMLAGTYNVRWNGTNDKGDNVSSGVYFYQLYTNGASETRHMTLLE
jgi:hypothetical protein